MLENARNTFCSESHKNHALDFLGWRFPVVWEVGTVSVPGYPMGSAVGAAGEGGGHRQLRTQQQAFRPGLHLPGRGPTQPIGGYVWLVAGRKGQALPVVAVRVAREEQRSVAASACPRHCFGARRVVESLQDGSNSILIVGGSNVAWPKDVNAFAQQIRGASAVLLQREIPEYVNEACSLKPGEDRCESSGTAGWHLMLSLPACFVFFLVSSLVTKF